MSGTSRGTRRRHADRSHRALFVPEVERQRSEKDGLRRDRQEFNYTQSDRFDRRHRELVWKRNRTRYARC